MALRSGPQIARTWRLESGEIARVWSVDSHGDFQLLNSEGQASPVLYRKYFMYV